ncbi:MAG: DNA alkylation repair protein [Myxococcota bacterium]|nr:DNA alkylation repair protein [Myxococcota bacterium]
MTLSQSLARLESLADPKMLNVKIRGGAQAQFGVPLGAIRKLAKEIKREPELAEQLWATGNLDARLLAILIVRPKDRSLEALEAMLQSCDCEQVASWLNNYLVGKHPQREQRRQTWMDSAHPWVARAGWHLSAQRAQKAPEGLETDALLDRIEAEMGSAPAPVQWTMNNTLAQIGINLPEHRARALAIGEALGVYRDYPVSKGCTSPYAPAWIGEMVRRAEG